MTYDGSYEDLFFYVEQLIVEGCGEDVGRPPAHRPSRNDIDMTMYRMRQREFVLGAAVGARSQLRRSLVDLAARHRETIFAVHTHTQRAQPTTVAHYLLAVVEQLERDASRLEGGLRTDESKPAGRVCHHRHRISDRPSAHLGICWASTARRSTPTAASPAVDYLLESASAAAVLLAGHGRFVQDLLLWCTAEFNYLRLSATASCSPAASCRRSEILWRIEHARAIASKALGQAQAICHLRPQHAVRRHRRYRGRSRSRWCSRCSATPLAP